MAAFAGLSRKHDVVPVIRDADVVAMALREALAEASPEERPGLERAAALVESTAAATEGRLRARWVRSRLAAVGFTGDIASVAAVKALRQAEPKLSLWVAVQLQKEALDLPE
ncbi:MULTISPECIES: hypothetical protein [unclassified Streptomyces]|uniref:hypothetical protein n=1 Tax=unclassified Streptomyces TaxID=2593676 RepID=UPI002E23EE36|nr:hypothetical protein OG217_13685 [Streptomyces sp. NBC_01023]